MAYMYAYGNRINYSQNSDCECNTSSSIGLTLSKKDINNIVPEILSTLSFEEMDAIYTKASKLKNKKEAEEREKILASK